MAARAMWKGVLRVGREEIPVKLYSAVQERRVSFRLLHETTKSPVKQRMVNPYYIGPDGDARRLRCAR